MKIIQNIDSTKPQVFFNGKWVTAKPEEGYGLLKWKRRFTKAWAVIIGKADAFIYSY